MSKKSLDLLLKKAEVYERLALYGDRKSFLRALAQQGVYVDTAFPHDNIISAVTPVQAKLQSVIRTIQNETQSNPQQISALMNADTAFGTMLQPQMLDDAGALAAAKALGAQLMGVSNAVKAILQYYGPAGTNQLSNDTAAYLDQLNREAVSAYSTIQSDPRIAKLLPRPPEQQPVATQTPETAPAQKHQQQAASPSAAAQSVANNMRSFAKSQLVPLGDQTGPKRDAVVKQINQMASYLVKLRAQIAAKKTKDLQDNFAAIAISSAFEEVYGSMTYDDLQKAPAFEFGRSPAFQQEI